MAATPRTGAPFDHERLLALVSGDTSLLRELVALARLELPGITGALRGAIERGDAEASGSAAHRLKGTLSNLGEGPALTLAGRIEEAAFSGDLTAVRADLAPLEQAMAELLRALEEIS